MKNQFHTGKIVMASASAIVLTLLSLAGHIESAGAGDDIMLSQHQTPSPCIKGRIQKTNTANEKVNFYQSFFIKPII